MLGGGAPSPPARTALRLLLVVAGLPPIATAARWHLAGREPSTRLRHAVDE
jgi:hypothetical protein